MNAIHLSGDFNPPSDLLLRCPLADCDHHSQYYTKAGFMHGVVAHFWLRHQTRVFFGGPREKQTTLSAIREKSRKALARDGRKC